MIYYNIVSIRHSIASNQENEKYPSALLKCFIPSLQDMF
jgi:hypothetical protein